uniref:Uncharacterized protein n=1 Tax=Oryza barthii TaxID=65489 RepID=A0A0D3EN56_9ORYZ
MGTELINPTPKPTHGCLPFCFRGRPCRKPSCVFSGCACADEEAVAVPVQAGPGRTAGVRRPSAVIFMFSYWLHFRSTMLPQEEQDTMRNAATLLESVAKVLLFHYGWRSSIRIAS